MKNLIHNFCLSHQNAEDRWKTSPFREIKELTNDARGELGETIVSTIFHSLGYEIDEDITNQNVKENGHYDLKVRDQRIEVKTTCADKQFQHEPLYTNNVCDLVVFLDFTYDKYWLTICKNGELPLGRDNKDFGNKHGTLRKNKDNGYKLDFSFTTIKSLIATGHTKQFTENSSIEELQSFVNSWWLKNV